MSRLLVGDGVCSGGTVGTYGSRLPSGVGQCAGWVGGGGEGGNILVLR